MHLIGICMGPKVSYDGPCSCVYGFHNDPFQDAMKTVTLFAYIHEDSRV